MKLRLSLSSLISVLALVSLGCATPDQAPATPTPSTTTATATTTTTTTTSSSTSGRPIFGWAIEGNGLDKPSYVFGSLHITPTGTVWRTPVIDAALTGARALFVEIDITALNPAEVQAMIGKQGIYLPPDNVAAHVTPESVAVIQAKAPGLGIPPPAVMQMRPWVLTLAATETLLKKDGWRGGPIDVVAINTAKDAGVPVVALETVGDQLALFANAPDQLQADMFVELVSHPETVVTYLTEQLHGPWQRGDEAALAAGLVAASSDDPRIRDFNKLVFDVRNKTMVEKLIPEFAVAGSEAVVVGAGHLVGETGILNALRARGYRVTQLQN